MSRAIVLEKLERRAYKSYLARVRAEKRLRSVGATWGAAQNALAVAMIAVSVLYLAFTESQSPLMAVYLVSLSVLALAVSISVGSLNYPGRAQIMFRNYRDIQAFSAKVEQIKLVSPRIPNSMVAELQSEYDLLLDQAENHSDSDFALSQLPSGDEGARARMRLIPRRIVPYLLPLILILVAVVTAILALISVL